MGFINSWIENRNLTLVTIKKKIIHRYLSEQCTYNHGLQYLTHSFGLFSVPKKDKEFFKRMKICCRDDSEYSRVTSSPFNH